MRCAYTVVIECGEITCNEREKSCVFLAIRRTGSEAVCLFPHGGPLNGKRVTPLRTREGWVIRSEDCKDAFKVVDSE